MGPGSWGCLRTLILGKQELTCLSLRGRHGVKQPISVVTLPNQAWQDIFQQDGLIRCELHSLSVYELHSLSVCELDSLSVCELHSLSVCELHTLSVCELHSLSVCELHTLSVWITQPFCLWIRQPFCLWITQPFCLWITHPFCLWITQPFCLWITHPFCLWITQPFCLWNSLFPVQLRSRPLIPHIDPMVWANYWHIDGTWSWVHMQVVVYLKYTQYFKHVIIYFQIHRTLKGYVKFEYNNYELVYVIL